MNVVEVAFGVINSFTALISVSALLVGLVIARKQLNSAREHSRKSVRPWLTLEIDFLSDPARFLIRNQGLGPAILKDVYFTLNGDRLGEALQSCVDASLNKAGLLARDATVKYGLEKGVGISPGSSLSLIEFQHHINAPPEHFEKYFRLSNISIVVIYEDIYGERHERKFMDVANSI